jgi:short-subunit dehydrogenase
VSGRVVLVTGASSGIGYEMALALVRQGDNVAATARRLDRLDQLAQAAKGATGELLILAADVTSASDMQRVVDDTVAKWGKIDVLIANAGLGQRGNIVDSAWEDLDIVIRTNVDGVLHSVRAAVPTMRKAGSGQIILIASVTAMAMTPFATIYAATKSMVVAIGRGLRVELRKDSIWVTSILLGQTHTEFAAARRGQPGKVAGKLPTMSAEWAAKRIIQEIGRKNTIVTLRWLDRVINAVGVYFPRIMDRIMERIYNK